MNKNLIEVKNLTKIFEIPREKKQTLKSHFLDLFRRTVKEKYVVLDDISIDIKSGEFVGIIGRNGSGKSTLLKIIAGIYLPDAGNIVVNGKIVPFLELGVGFNPELSGRENIFLNGSILGMSKKFLQKSFDEIVDFAELRNFIDAPLKNYSSGMQVRLAFSIAIKAVADIYILDEILAVGDENFQRKSISVINQLKEEGKTIIFVSHDMNSIQKYCTRALLLHEGKVFMDDIPSKVAEKYHELNADGSIASTMARRQKRWGNKYLEITKVTILNEKNKKTNIFNQENKIRLKAEYKLNKKISNDVIFGFAIYKEDGTNINGTNTRNNNFKFKYSKRGLITYEIPANILLTGKYFISVVAFDSMTNEEFDFHSQMYEIIVDNNIKDRGNIVLPAKFTHEIL